ncbi:NUDIX hydrolase [Agriterribacter sp.]|uniref:NUDIX hydrolase n=1 Tax=Agriterribacter sp. TaxID=2821509 RepID=UPI002BA357D8|nr:NUDIX hydrolase [Agriterribacter sp.]HTN06411.1 NUDIX hydrolase [Agriterribacter sp.]
MNDQHNPWQIIDQRPIYDNQWIQVTEYNVINPGGGKGIYGKVHFKNIAIGIVALDEEGNTWLIGQYRFPINAYSWEIPEGGGDLHTDPLISAQRELLEEAGIKARKWDKVLDMHLSNSVTNETCVVYLARGLSFHEAAPEESEQLVIKKLPFTKAFDMVISGAITDAVSVAAIFKVNYLLKNNLI